MYRWRKMTPEQRDEELKFRQLSRHPLHSPVHHDSGRRFYLITAACYEHRPHIGFSESRMDDFSKSLLSIFHGHGETVDAWIVLPDHYHALVLAPAVLDLLKALGKLHGKSAFLWNGEENRRGRKVWCGSIERAIKSDHHHLVALQYIHHNPVKHGHVRKWDEWKWSSVREYIDRIGREEAARRWRECPLQDFGKGWDD